MALPNTSREAEVDQLVQMRQRLLGDRGEGIELEEDDEIVCSLNNLILVGKLLADKIVNKGVMRNDIRHAWDLRLGVTITYLTENIFLLNLKAKMNRTCRGGPWTIMGNHLVLKRWHANTQVRDIYFWHSWLWVQVFGIPHKIKHI